MKRLWNFYRKDINGGEGGTGTDKSKLRVVTVSGMHMCPVNNSISFYGHWACKRKRELDPPFGHRSLECRKWPRKCGKSSQRAISTEWVSPAWKMRELPMGEICQSWPLDWSVASKKCVLRTKQDGSDKLLACPSMWLWFPATTRERQS